MLVKLNSNEYSEDYGILTHSDNGDGNYIHMFDHGVVPLNSNSKLQSCIQPVIRATVVWMDKDVKVSCHIADTIEKKRVGLQSHMHLPSDRGMYFPYPGYRDVSFHQGNVPYPLDIMFLKDSEIIKVELDTKVGGTDFWQATCDGVIEVNSGFCKKNEIIEGDRITIFAFSQQDDDNYKYEQRSDNLIREMVRQDSAL